MRESRDGVSGEERYSRQILFPGIGTKGQELLAQGTVVIVGVGATGAASASLLARAGVGRLRLIDRDFVESSNLQRQILFDEEDAAEGLPKAEAARRKVARFNSAVEVEARIADLVPGNVAEMLAGADLVLDATDNFETRYLINDYAVLHGMPWIYAAAVGAYAATMNVLPKGGPGQVPAWRPTACLACLFPKPPEGAVATCDTAGILASAANLAASLQVTEAMKLLTGQTGLMRRTLISFDLWETVRGGRLDRAEIDAGEPRADCEVCEGRRFVHLSGEQRPHITLCGRNSVQIHEHGRPIDLEAMRLRLAGNSELTGLRANTLLLRFTRGSNTVTVFADGRAVVQGTTDATVARSLYARFIGS